MNNTSVFCLSTFFISFSLCGGQSELIEPVTSLLVPNNIDINKQDPQGNTILHKAAKQGLESFIRVLLEHHADPNIRNNQGDAPLHCAVENGHTAAALALLEDIRTDPNIKNTNLDTPLHRAATHGLLQVVTALLARGANPNERNSDSDMPLHRAIENQHENIARQLLTNQDTDINSHNKYGDAPLHRAVFHNLHGIIDALTNHGANVDVKNNNGETPLHLAASLPSVMTLRTLLTNGASVSLNTQNKHGSTPLHYAIRHQQIENIQELVRFSGINPNVQRLGVNKAFFVVPGKTPLADALSLEPIDTYIPYLLLQMPKLNVNISDATGKTPLIHVIRAYKPGAEQCIPIIKELLQRKGIDLAARDADNHTALDYAHMSAYAKDLVPLFSQKTI